MSGGSSTRKGPKRQGQTLQPTDHKWKIPKATKSRDDSRDEEMEKVDDDGRHSRCGRGR